jgi:hypothetical protein
MLKLQNKDAQANNNPNGKLYKSLSTYIIRMYIVFKNRVKFGCGGIGS